MRAQRAHAIERPRRVSCAGVMLVTLGAFHAGTGMSNLVDSSYYLGGSSSPLVEHDGVFAVWASLVLGSALFATAAALYVGHVSGRTVGVVVALLSALRNLVMLDAYPLLPAVMMATEVIVIYSVVMYALVLHDREPSG